MSELTDAMIGAVLSGIVSGLVTYGGLKVKLFYMDEAIKKATDTAERAEAKGDRALTILDERKAR